MSAESRFTPKDRWQDHEAVRQLRDIMRRHALDLSGADLSAFRRAIDAILGLERRLNAPRPVMPDITMTQAWFMGEAAELEGFHRTENPFPEPDPRRRAWDLGFLQIPQDGAA